MLCVTMQAKNNMLNLEKKALLILTKTDDKWAKWYSEKNTRNVTAFFL